MYQIVSYSVTVTAVLKETNYRSVLTTVANERALGTDVFFLTDNQSAMSCQIKSRESVGSTLIALCAHVWQWIRKVGFLELIFLVFQTGRASFFDRNSN